MSVCNDFNDMIRAMCVWAMRVRVCIFNISGNMINILCLYAFSLPYVYIECGLPSNQLVQFWCRRIIWFRFRICRDYHFSDTTYTILLFNSKYLCAYTLNDDLSSNTSLRVLNQERENNNSFLKKLQSITSNLPYMFADFPQHMLGLPHVQRLWWCFVAAQQTWVNLYK